jgi:hypothetical integral membrane protein (TIGR02206 family)
MLKYFWADGSDIPSEMDTPNFSPGHIAWAISAFLLILLILLLYRRQSPTTRERIKRGFILFLLGSEIAVWIWKLAIGHYSFRDTLPLHLCSQAIFIELAAVFIRKDTLFKEFSYSLAMPAAFSAIITPGWYYPFFSFAYLQSAIMHMILILIPVLIVWGDGFRPDYRRLPRCFSLLLLLAAMTAIADIVFDSNYMFLCYVPKDTPLQVFEVWFGNPGYMIPEIALIFVIWTVLYLPWVIADRRRKRMKVDHDD